MRINDFFNEVAKIINNEREERGISSSGHVIGICNIKKKIGPFREGTIDVIYVNTLTKVNTTLFTTTYIGNLNKESTSLFNDRLILSAICKFLEYYSQNKEKLITGQYGN